MAEAYYNHFTNSNASFSAGVSDYTPMKYGNPIKEVIQVMQEDGIDISKKEVKFVNEEMARNSDRIFVMCKKEECPDFLLNPEKVIFWDIADPFDTDLENFRKIRDEIKAKIRKLLEEKKY